MPALVHLEFHPRPGTRPALLALARACGARDARATLEATEPLGRPAVERLEALAREGRLAPGLEKLVACSADPDPRLSYEWDDVSRPLVEQLLLLAAPACDRVKGTVEGDPERSLRVEGGRVVTGDPRG